MIYLSTFHLKHFYNDFILQPEVMYVVQLAIGYKNIGKRLGLTKNALV